MRIEATIEKFSEFADPKLLMRSISKPMEHLSEDVSTIIPSIIIANDGLSLRGLALITNNYICDIRIGRELQYNYDFVHKHTVYNLRFNLGHHDIVVDEQVVDAYEIAEVKLLHGLRALETRFKFAGSGRARNDWMADVRKEFPLDLLLHGV